MPSLRELHFRVFLKAFRWRSERLALVKVFLPIQNPLLDKFDIVVPSVSILAEPPVAVVDANAARRGTAAVAEAYLRFLYTPEGQEIAARNFYRPRDAAVAARYSRQFPATRMLTIDGDFGGWAAAQSRHFRDGGVFDTIFAAAKR